MTAGTDPTAFAATVLAIACIVGISYTLAAAIINALTHRHNDRTTR